MGQLYDAKVRLDQLIQQKNLDPVQVKGQIGMKAGFLLSLVSANTPDDPAKLEGLRRAVRDVLQATI